MRIKTRWSKKDKERSAEEIAGALAFIVWRIGAAGLLSLENEGFQTDTYTQRLKVLSEFLAFLIHVTDRMTYERFTEEERERFVTALALKIAQVMEDNMRDLIGPGDYKGPFIELLNERLADYSEFSYTEEGPGFGFKRYFGERVTEVMGPKDGRWITDQIMDAEVPDALKTLRRAFVGLFPEKR